MPGDIKQTREAMTGYLTDKMSSTNSALYKATAGLDNAKVQKFIKADEKVLNEIGKIAPVTGSAGSLAKDILSGQLSKTPADIVKTRAAMTAYISDKMPSTDSWLYKNTNFVDNPTVQKIARVDQKVLDEVGKVAPVVTSTSALVKDMSSFQLDKVPGDVRQTREAMTGYFTNKMSSTDSWLYKNTNILDKPAMQKFVKLDEKALTAIQNLW